MLGVPQAWGKGRGESYTLFQTLPIVQGQPEKNDGGLDLTAI